MSEVIFTLSKSSESYQQVRINVLNSIASLLNEYGSLDITLKKHAKSKTMAQQRYAHACIGVIAKEVGDNPEALKVRIKVALGLIEEYFAGGKVITQTRSTSTLNREEYGQFIDAIQQTANHLNIILPQPKDMGFYW